MKKVYCVLVFLSVLLLVGGVFSLSPAEAQEKVWNLKGSTGVPASGPRWQMVVDFCAKLKEQTNGRVDLKVTPAGGLAPLQEEWAYLSKGLIDFGIPSNAWTSKFNPPMGILLAALVKAEDVVPLMKAGLYDAMERQARKDNIKLLSLWTSLGFQGVHTRTRFCKTLADFKGLMVYTSGPFVDKAHESLGCKLVPIATAELLSGMQTGVLDGGTTGVAATRAYKFFEATPYITAFPGGYNLGLYTYDPAFNLNVWNSFPPDIQQTIMRLGEELAKESPARWMKEREEAEAFYKSIPQRVHFYQLTEKEAQDLLSVVKGPLWELYLKEGGAAAQEMKGIVDKYLASK